MSGPVSDNMQWRSLNAPFNEQGNSLVLRDIETLFLAMQQLQSAVGLNNTGAPVNASQSLAPAPVPPGVSPSPITALPVTIAQGGTGQTTQAAAITALTGTQTNGRYLRSNGTNAVLASLAAADMTGTLAIANGGTAATTALAGLRNLVAVAAVEFGSPSSSFVVPSGVYRMRAILIGAGGEGVSASGSFSQTLGYIDSTSGGGTTNVALSVVSANAIGGGGAMCIADFDVTPGETLTASRALANSSPGGTSGSSTLSDSSGVILRAYSGGAAVAGDSFAFSYHGEPGLGGDAIGSARRILFTAIPGTGLNTVATRLSGNTFGDIQSMPYTGSIGGFYVKYGSAATALYGNGTYGSAPGDGLVLLAY